MKLILDSGGTKTAWALLSEGRVKRQGTLKGMNPYAVAHAELISRIQSIAHSVEPEAVEEVAFYGAGCRASDSKELLVTLWSKAFPHSRIHIFDDLTGVAHALGEGRGCIPCILGTGASAGYYEQGRMQRYAPSNGVWLGDEGSGADLGKRLIKAYLDQALPKDLTQQFESRFLDRREDILRKVYREQEGAAYMGSFAPFLKEQSDHPFIDALLSEAFSAFFTHIKVHLPEAGRYPLLMAGGVAAAFFAKLQKEASAQELRLPLASKEVLPGLLQQRGLVNSATS